MNVADLKLATWNVNSLKIRLPQVLDFLDKNSIDVLALQETKTIDADFPESEFIAQNLHVAFTGQKTYNGVAIISKYPLEDICIEIPDYADPQRRFLAVTVCGVRLINLYVPNGASVDSDKYQYKMEWLKYVTQFIKEQLALFPNLAVVGDLNIAPEDIDVHDPKVWEGNVMVSPGERAAFANLLALGLKDSLRTFSQEALFSWWDYRAASFRRNLGLRIDHILLSESLHSFCKSCVIDKEPRKHERPSDHTPVYAIFSKK